MYFNNVSKTFLLFKWQFLFEKPINLPFDLDALCDFLSTNLDQSKKFLFELLIKLLTVFFYLLEIVIISNFSFISLITYLTNHFQKIVKFFF